MRVRLRNKPKPNHYTESCMINEADGWTGRNVWYPRETCVKCFERGNRICEDALNAQESAEVIVSWNTSWCNRRRTKSIGVFSTTRKGGTGTWVQKTQKAACKEIARNVKGM